MHNECKAPAFWAEPPRQGAACILGLVRESIDWQTLVTRQGTLSIDVIPLGHGTSNGDKFVSSAHAMGDAESHHRVQGVGQEVNRLLNVGAGLLCPRRGILMPRKKKWP